MSGRGRVETGSISAETVTAVAAIVTAVVALAVGVWNNIQTRRHNRLSVIPHLVFVAELGDVDEPGDDREGAPREGGTLTLRNEGVGPAVVDSVSVHVLGPDSTQRAHASLPEAAEPLERAQPGVEILGTTDIGSGSVIASGREVPLLRFAVDEGAVPDTLAGEGADLAVALLDRLTMVVHYHSVYGDAHADTLGAVRPAAGGGD